MSLMSGATTYNTIGATLAIAASIFNAIGYIIQKKGHNGLNNYNKDKKENAKKRLINSKIWLIGFAIYLIGGGLNAVSLFYAPQSLVLPLSAITLVANTVLATKVLDEPFSKGDIFGIFTVVIGSVLAVIFGPQTNSEWTMDELKVRWADADFFLFFVIFSVWIVIIYVMVQIYERKNVQELKHESSFLLISYCFFVGYFGALSFLFIKSFTAFIANVEAEYGNWYSYFTLLCVLISNILLEFFRQRGLAHFHAVYVVPINQVLLILMGTVLGGLYFQEFYNMTILKGLMFSVAILTTVVGVCILAFNSGSVPVVSEKMQSKINPHDTMQTISLPSSQTFDIEITDIDIEGHSLSTATVTNNDRIDSLDGMEWPDSTESTDLLSISSDTKEDDIYK